jgi:hypothetical protein
MATVLEQGGVWVVNSSLRLHMRYYGRFSVWLSFGPKTINALFGFENWFNA